MFFNQSVFRNMINNFFQGSSALTWEQIITLNHDAKVVSSKLKFDPATGILIERYNLEGMMVFGQATNWAPFRVSS